MTPRQFFDNIADENARLAIAARHDLRLAINAIITLNAFFGILQATLYEKGVAGVPRDDDKWKEKFAQQSDEYRLLGDAAFALKHGKNVKVSHLFKVVLEAIAAANQSRSARARSRRNAA